ncbi:hypothetical protein [Thermogladius sp.]|uniref:hypothetical protein n=1 Tax=Thermogladius sp. TaxID=2023064 RepID=UPI003D0A54BD
MGDHKSYTEFVMTPPIHRINVVSTLVEVDDRRFNATQLSVKGTGSFTVEIGPGVFKLSGQVFGDLRVVDEGDLVTVESGEVTVNTRIEKEDFIIEDNVLYGYSKPMIVSVSVNKDVITKLNYKYSYKSANIKIRIDGCSIYFNAITSPFLSAWLYINEGVVYVEKELAGLNIAVLRKQERREVREVISQEGGLQPSLT